MTTDILPAAPPPRTSAIQPLDIRETRAAMTAYQTGLREIVDESDYQQFKGRDGETNQFLKRSGWRKIATWFSLDLTIISRDIERGEDGRIIRAHCVSRATAPNGRYADGDGGCSINERGFSKPEHDIPAVATTRATNRAISNLVGMGAVSADEMDGSAEDVGAVLNGKQAKELAQKIQARYPDIDAFSFLRVLSRRFKDAGLLGIPQAAADALDGWLWWTGNPPTSAGESPETGADAPTTTTTED